MLPARIWNHRLFGCSRLLSNPSWPFSLSTPNDFACLWSETKTPLASQKSCVTSSRKFDFFQVSTSHPWSPGLTASGWQWSEADWLPGILPLIRAPSSVDSGSLCSQMTPQWMHGIQLFSTGTIVISWTSTAQGKNPSIWWSAKRARCPRFNELRHSEQNWENYHCNANLKNSLFGIEQDNTSDHLKKFASQPHIIVNGTKQCSWPWLSSTPQIEWGSWGLIFLAGMVHSVPFWVNFHSIQNNTWNFIYQMCISWALCSFLSADVQLCSAKPTAGSSDRGNTPCLPILVHHNVQLIWADWVDVAAHGIKCFFMKRTHWPTTSLCCSLARVWEWKIQLSKLWLPSSSERNSSCNSVCMCIPVSSASTRTHHRGDTTHVQCATNGHDRPLRTLHHYRRMLRQVMVSSTRAEAYGHLDSVLKALNCKALATRTFQHA